MAKNESKIRREHKPKIKTATKPMSQPILEPLSIVYEERATPVEAYKLDDKDYKKRAKKQGQNALIIDRERGWYLDHVEPNQISQPSSRMWRFGKQYVYSLEIIREKSEPQNAGDIPVILETLRPFEPADTVGTLPDKGYRALFWKEAEILFTLENTLLDKLNLIGMYVLIGIMLFFIYLLISSLGGN